MLSNKIIQAQRMEHGKSLIPRRGKKKRKM